MKHTFRLLYLLSIISIVILLFSISSPKKKYPDNSLSVYKLENWQYQFNENQNNLNFLSEPWDSSNWRNYEIYSTPSNPKERTEIWIRTKLSENYIRDPHLCFKTNDQEFKVYLNGKLIYFFGNFEEPLKMQSPGSHLHNIPLPEDYQGGTLAFQMRTPIKKNLGSIRKADLGPRSTHILKLIKENTLNVSLSISFIFLGLVISILVLCKRIHKKAFLALSFSSISSGIWVLSNSVLNQLFYYNPRFWICTSILSFYFVSIGFCFFIESIYGDKKNKILQNLGYSMILFSIVSLFLDLSAIYPITLTLNYYYILLFISVYFYFLYTFKAYKKKKKEAIYFFLGLFGLFLFCTYDILGWHFKLIPWRTFLTPYGMLILVFHLLGLLGKRFNLMHEKVEIYSDTVKLQDEVLIQKQKLLNEALEYDKIKTEFFSNISHELRTPLNIILSTTQLLDLHTREDSCCSKKEKLNKYVKIMNQNAFRLIRLVNNLIDINKIDAGYLKINLENHNIIQIVEDITLSVADYVKNKNLSLTFDTEIEEKIIACDPDKIERIMLNLLSNAVKFSKLDSEIFVSIEEKENLIYIKVKDTGIGIEKEKISSIFERFSQVDKSLTRSHEGSGIGLSLVRSLVEMHQGVITVESEYEEGTTFTIVLPTIKLSSEKHSNPSETTILVNNHIEKINIEFSDIYS